MVLRELTAEELLLVSGGETSYGTGVVENGDGSITSAMTAFYDDGTYETCIGVTSPEGDFTFVGCVTETDT